jgi:flagellar hook-length control protein FliK
MNLIMSAVTEPSVRTDPPASKTQSADKTRPEGSFMDYMTDSMPFVLQALQTFLQEIVPDAGPSAASADAGSETAPLGSPVSRVSPEGFKMSKETDTQQNIAENNTGDKAGQDNKAGQTPGALLKKEVSANGLNGSKGLSCSDEVSGGGADVPSSFFNHKDPDAGAVPKVSPKTDADGGTEKRTERCAPETPPEMAAIPDGDAAAPGHEFVKPAPRAEASSSPETVAVERTNDQKKDRSGQSSETRGKSENIFSPVDKAGGPENGKVVFRKTETPEVGSVSRDTFEVTKKNDTSIEVSIEPDGIGKLDIRLNSDRGVIHARIDASESVGRELIDRNLDSIINTLAGDGINIGSFSINLRGGQKQSEDMGNGPRYVRETAEEAGLPDFHTGDSLINIFV